MMPARSVRNSRQSEPVIHDLPSMRYDGEEIVVRLQLRRTDDGTWRGRLLFGADVESARCTAEIFCAVTEKELWRSVGDLRDHHFRDLYRSVV